MDYLKFKRGFFLLIFPLLCLINLQAQVLNPVDWSFTAITANDGNVEVIAKASIKSNWAVYSMSVPEDGPIPTAISFEEQPGIEPLGEVKELGKAITGKDEMFEMVITKYKNDFSLSQKFKVGPNSKNFKGYVTFMCCNDEMCLPPKDVPFDIPTPK